MLLGHANSQENGAKPRFDKSMATLIEALLFKRLLIAFMDYS